MDLVQKAPVGTTSRSKANIMTSWVDAWEDAKVNRSKRPILEDGEHNVYLRDGIGLYQGKYKIINRQNGRIYLTNKRIIYVDDKEVEASVYVSLTDIESSEFVERFLRSSPKVKLYLREKKTRETDGPDSGISPGLVDWVCTICSFNNHMPIDENLSRDIRCVSCGIRPPVSLLKKAIEAKREEQTEIPQQGFQDTGLVFGQCPTCTFINHPSLQFCEMCGSSLSSPSVSLKPQHPASLNQTAQHVHCQVPILMESSSEEYTNDRPYIKLSFRKGGENKFYTHLNQVLDDLKWDMLKKRGGVNANATKVEIKYEPKEPIMRSGIHGLEQLGEEQRKANAYVLSTSLEDFKQLMHRSQDLIELSRSFGSLLKYTNITSTIPPMNISKTSKLYHEELSRHLSEYLINCLLNKSSSMVTSQDLYAHYNRYIITTQGLGSSMILPSDFNKAIALFDRLKLPIATKLYEKSGIVVLRYRSTTSYSEFIAHFLREQETKAICRTMKEYIILGSSYPTADLESPDLLRFFEYKGCTVPELREGLGWSYSIILEELEMCLEAGIVVVDHDILSPFYFLNRFTGDFRDLPSLKHLYKESENEVANEQTGIEYNLASEAQHPLQPSTGLPPSIEALSEESGFDSSFAPLTNQFNSLSTASQSLAQDENSDRLQTPLQLPQTSKVLLPSHLNSSSDMLSQPPHTHHNSTPASITRSNTTELKHAFTLIPTSSYTASGKPNMAYDKNPKVHAESITTSINAHSIATSRTVMSPSFNDIQDLKFS